MPPTTPKRVPFTLGTLFEDPGLCLPEYCTLSFEEQEAIRIAVNSDWRKRHDIWERKSESDHFVDRFSFLFKVCAFHKHQWESPTGKTTPVFWNKVKRSAQWTQYTLNIDMVRKLTILLFDARMKHIANSGDCDGHALHPISSAIQAFFNAMKVRFPATEDFECWLCGMKEEARKGT